VIAFAPRDPSRAPRWSRRDDHRAIQTMPHVRVRSPSLPPIRHTQQLLPSLVLLAAEDFHTIPPAYDAMMAFAFHPPSPLPR
jgi:hypothetical protein